MEPGLSSKEKLSAVASSAEETPEGLIFMFSIFNEKAQDLNSRQ